MAPHDPSVEAIHLGHNKGDQQISVVGQLRLDQKPQCQAAVGLELAPGDCGYDSHVLEKDDWARLSQMARAELQRHKVNAENELGPN